MSAFKVVEQFERALGRYTGAPQVVTTDSCTNALMLAMAWCRERDPVDVAFVYVPRHTYVGVVHAARNAGYEVKFDDKEWHEAYALDPLPVVDAAKVLEPGMFDEWRDPRRSPWMVCVSFHVAKRLPLGRGGAVLLDDPGAADWLRRARFDGRTAGETGGSATRVTSPGWHCYLTPPEAARGLWLLEQFLDAAEPSSWRAYPDLRTLL